MAPKWPCREWTLLSFRISLCAFDPPCVRLKVGARGRGAAVPCLWSPGPCSVLLLILSPAGTTSIPGKAHPPFQTFFLRDSEVCACSGKTTVNNLLDFSVVNTSDALSPGRSVSGAISPIGVRCQWTLRAIETYPNQGCSWPISVRTLGTISACLEAVPADRQEFQWRVLPWNIPT